MLGDSSDSVLDFRALIQSRNYDFVDFGCSKGGSLEFAKSRLGGRHGLGIDINPAKVEATIAAGYDAIRYDIHNIPAEKLVRFVVLSHFLEHVPNYLDVQAFVQKACEISKEFVYIKQPFFDADPYLLAHGLKLFWSDWTGHPNRMTALEIFIMLRNLQSKGLSIAFSIHAHSPIRDSNDPRIHPLASRADQHEYSETSHPNKGVRVSFRNNVFAELLCLITFPGTSHKEILQRLRYDHTIIDEEGKAIGYPQAGERIEYALRNRWLATLKTAFARLTGIRR